MANEFVIKNGYFSQGNSNITGSLTVSNGITSSLFGTSSWANNSITASYFLTSSVTSASLSQTASYVVTAQTASYFLTSSVTSASFASNSTNAATASYFITSSVTSASLAQTASYLNTLNQNLTFNGNLTLNGTASITYLNVAYESSSIIFSSGSNQLGDAVADTQTLMGTVKITGSLNVTGSANIPSITGSLLGTSSWSNNAITSSYIVTAQTASYFFTSSVTSASFAQTASYILNAVSASRSQTASFVTPLTQNVQITGSLIISASGTTNDLLIGTNKLFVSASGNIGIGTTNPTIKLDVQESTGTGNQIVGRFLAGTNTNGSAGGITLGSTQTQAGYIYGVQTATSTGDLVFGNQYLGSYAERMRILGNGNVGIDTTNPLAKFVVSNAGTQSVEIGYSVGLTSNYLESFNRSSSLGVDMSYYIANTGAHRFFTDGSERMRIQPAGNVGIGTTSPTEKLTVAGNIFANAGNNEGFKLNGGLSIYRLTGDDLGFFTANNERMRITSAGYVGIGTTTPNSTLDVNGNTIITGSLNHGVYSKTIGNYSHAEGYSTNAFRDYSHAQGSFTYAGGVASHAEGWLTSASGQYSHAEGYGVGGESGYLIASGFASHAEGISTRAAATGSHSEGSNTYAGGIGSHAEGVNTNTIGQYSHAEGSGTNSNGAYAHAEGSGTNAFGASSHAEGEGTLSSGSFSHAEGGGSIASGSYSHAEGYLTHAEGSLSHAEGLATYAIGSGSHAEGWDTNASGSYSHAEGKAAIAQGFASHAEGEGYSNGYASHAEGSSSALGMYSHAEGYGTIAFGTGSHAEGYFTSASGAYSHTEGSGSIARGYVSHAEGTNAIAFDTGSHAEGLRTIASGSYSHAEGQDTIARGGASHAEGVSTIAHGDYSHAEGLLTISSGSYSHAEGYWTTAKANFSHTEGFLTVADGLYQTVVGTYNLSSSLAGAFIIGNGVNISGIRSNLVYASGSAFQITGSLLVSTGNVGIGISSPTEKLDVVGNIKSSGTVTATGISYAGSTSGFANTTYASNVRNPIWRFGNADTFGLSYFHGSTGVGGFDSIGFHFGTATIGSSVLQINRTSGTNTVTTAGNVGILTTTATYPLTVNGQPGANGYTAFTNYSDIRLKDNITDFMLTGSLDKIKQLRPVSFNYNSLTGYDSASLARTNSGFIAQELKEVCPEMVGTIQINDIEYLDTNTSNLNLYLIRAIQEQQKIIEDLTNRIILLESK